MKLNKVIGIFYGNNGTIVPLCINIEECRGKINHKYDIYIKSTDNKTILKFINYSVEISNIHYGKGIFEFGIADLVYSARK